MGKGSIEETSEQIIQRLTKEKNSLREELKEATDSSKRHKAHSRMMTDRYGELWKSVSVLHDPLLGRAASQQLAIAQINTSRAEISVGTITRITLPALTIVSSDPTTEFSG